jgi:hypothetical protein
MVNQGDKKNLKVLTIYLKLIQVNCKLISSEHKEKFKVTLKTISCTFDFIVSKLFGISR